MKMKITKTLKVILLMTNIILITGVATYLYLYYATPHFIDESIVKYKYTQKGEVNYQVFLKPNNLYSEGSMEEGKIYLTQIIDYIKINFSYIFEGNVPASIKGNYEIIAVIEGYTKDNEITKTIWKKVFPVIKKTYIEANKENISIDKTAIIKLAEYEEYARSIMQAIKVNSSARLSVQMNVDLTADIDEVFTQEKMSPSIEMPLNVSYFTISKLNNEEKPGIIEETRQVEVPADMKKIILCGMIIGILIVSLLFIIIFTIEPTEEHIYIKKFTKIFKNHGNRLVALKSKIDVPDKPCCNVRSIDDLVKIADELGRPVLYVYSPNYMEIDRFYVSGDTWIYILDIKDYIYSLIDRNIFSKTVIEQKEENCKTKDLPGNS